jgi:Rrf2 family nitric oxide-sensitive transcriptional repressor
LLNKTSQTAIQALLFIAEAGGGSPTSPGKIAEHLGASPSYMAKISTLLVKADILQTFRGMYGGVTLSRAPEEIRLLEIVEACQGRILADYCQDHPRLKETCAYHQAMSELQGTIVGTLEKWTLADIAEKPGPSARLRGAVPCRMVGTAP